MNISLISTGGTIATTDESDGAVPRLSGDALLGSIPEVDNVDQIITNDIFTIPSTHLHINDIYELYAEIERLNSKSNIDAIIVTHGTDTLEESAYFIDLCYEGTTPVIFTGAMRKPTQVGSDGAANLYAAVQFACQARAEHGVLVTFADKAFTARTVTKVDANKVNAFAAPGWGPVGTLIESRANFHFTPVRQDPYLSPDPDILTDDVVILTISAGMNSRFGDAAVNAEGIIVAGTGGGHVTPSLVKSLQQAAENNVPIVVTTRCQSGEPTRQTYDIIGSERTLQELGAFYSNVVAWKARMKLIATLASKIPVEKAFDRPTSALSNSS